MLQNVNEVNKEHNRIAEAASVYVTRPNVIVSKQYIYFQESNRVFFQDTGLQELLFFNHGPEWTTKPPPWDNLPFGGTVKVVDHETSSGFEFPRSYHFANISGSPTIIVNAKKVGFLTVSTHLVK